jgi:hypothetical protein
VLALGFLHPVMAEKDNDINKMQKLFMMLVDAEMSVNLD